MTTIKIHNSSEVLAQGRTNNKNCTPIYNITENKIYTSVLDAAADLRVNPSSISWVLTGRMKTCKGNKLCRLSEVLDHFGEITELNKANAEKAKAYDELIAKQEELAKAKATVAKHKNHVEKLLADLNRERHLLAEAEAKMAELEAN